MKTTRQNFNMPYDSVEVTRNRMEQMLSLVRYTAKAIRGSGKGSVVMGNRDTSVHSATKVGDAVGDAKI